MDNEAIKGTEDNLEQPEKPNPMAEGGKKKKSAGTGHHHKETEELRNKLNELNDKYLRLSADFDNYRKRTLKEKMDLTRYGGETVLSKILPVVDNLERAMSSMRETTDIGAVKEGIELIYGHFKDFLKQNGVVAIESLNQDFNSDLHEAVTTLPVNDPEQKGKIVEVIQEGYVLHDRVIRFAKVIVGE